ncbi:icarapin-like [Solenopsis invicta]|uniref:icarapin-like n=1 Tax=Solenopsis invicta TaxID=13686 RepID=UPI0005960DA5|nr:icarapin-like [Solenopsis invicta]
MKTLHVLLVAACLIACTRGYPSRNIAGYDSDEDFETNYDFSFPSFPNFADYWNLMQQRVREIAKMFSNPLNPTDFKIPEGANRTSTTKIINGHVVTINETTYTSGDDENGTAFRIRIIDIKPQNSTDTTLPPTTVVGGNPQPTVKPEPEAESRETLEDFNNEIPKNTPTLNA